MARRTMILALTTTLLGVGALAQQQTKVEGIRASPEQKGLVGGEQLYLAFCAACHGKDGHGGGPAAQALKTRPSDLTRLAERASGSYPTSRVRRYILGQGRVRAHGTEEMPVWGPFFLDMAAGEQLFATRAQNLVDYIESIQVPKK